MNITPIKQRRKVTPAKASRDLTPVKRDRSGPPVKKEENTSPVRDSTTTPVRNIKAAKKSSSITQAAKKALNKSKEQNSWK